MASARLTCPDCRSVLKPAKPVPDGKKVKCPKCGTLFTSPGLAGDVEEQPRKKASAKAAKAGIKKAPGPEAAPPKPAAAGDDDEGGIYSYVPDEEPTQQEKDDKPDIEFAPDMSIKDLRGPAQAAVVSPSNYMILLGALCCICDILIICVMFWPMVFSDSVVNYEKVLEDYYKSSGDKDVKNKISSIPKERKELKDKELEIVEEAEHVQYVARFIIMGVYIFLLLYNGLTIFGAVKMQNLESRGWGIASSILTILPMGSTGVGAVISFLFFLLFAMLLDDANMGMLYAGGVSVLVWILAIVVGVWSLRTLMSEEVIAGFEYVAD